MKTYCPDCNTFGVFDPAVYCCVCGGALEPVIEPGFDKNQIFQKDSSLWRYARAILSGSAANPLRLGAGWTPLLPLTDDGESPMVKLEYYSPTASFKDRGTEVEFTILRSMGVNKAVEDSSGNAGASAAAYAARAGIQLKIYAPQSASLVKISQIKAFGAETNLIAGVRQNATDACLETVKRGVCYASHAWNPAYLLGQTTFAWEIWEQMDYAVPDEIFFPVGQGGLLMGAWLGFRSLLEAKKISRLPRLSIVQPKNNDPLIRAIHENWEEWQTIPATPSQADGLAVARPIRWKRIRQAVVESGGRAVSVSEEEINIASQRLAKLGFFVEPSSAVALAGFSVVSKTQYGSKTIIPLTGSGLKTTQNE